MHSLAALTPLGGPLPKTEKIGTLTISEITNCALASVTLRRGKDQAFAVAAETLFATALPAPGVWQQAGVYGLIWTGPDQWFIEAPFASHEDIAQILKAGLGDSASVTEQTGGWVRFDVQGARVVDLLERLCPAPSRRMQTGAATRTLLEHMGCLVICRETAQHFSLLAPRSYAKSLAHALTAAARSIG